MTVHREYDLFITSMISDRIGRHEVLFPINHRNYNFREKKYSIAMKERKIWIKRLKKVDLNYNLLCELRKMFFRLVTNNNLESELVENRSF